MAAKMRYMGYIALTTHQANHGHIEQREPEGIPQSCRDWGQTIRDWWQAFGFGVASRPGHTDWRQSSATSNSQQATLCVINQQSTRSILN